MNRIRYFDVLKAFAIIAVVLYHMGVCQSGYLGVDVFLVISGYFTAKSVIKQMSNPRGGEYISFVLNKIFRLLPVLLIAGCFCLVFGYFLFLPDDFENLCQSIVATNLFVNNILQCITTKNYWDVVNEYKPLMHTWYVGIIMQFYVTVPLLLFMIKKRVKQNKEIWMVSILIVITIISLLLYLLSDYGAEKFYYLPFRLFELCLGAIIFFISQKIQSIKYSKFYDVIFIILYVCLLSIVFIDFQFMNKPLKLLIVVIVTGLLITIMPLTKVSGNSIFSNKFLSLIGCASYSIFVWHQVVYACVRYSFTSDLIRIDILLITTILIAVLSLISYRYVEKLQKNKYTWSAIIMLFVLTTGFSLIVYKNAGVVRDVPELNIVKGNVKRGQWAEYCDRGYDYNKGFEQSAKPKWFIVGNSFGRDFVNIILESPIKDRVEVSYSDMLNYKNCQTRFQEADVVFLSTLGVDDSIIDDVKSLCLDDTKFIIVGEKNFGECNGQVYRHRNKPDYFTLTNKMMSGFEEKNNYLKTTYSNNYIDLISMVIQPNGEVRVFTDNGKFISQDCRHLTQDGAMYYSKLIDWTQYF